MVEGKKLRVNRTSGQTTRVQPSSRKTSKLILSNISGTILVALTQPSEK